MYTELDPVVRQCTESVEVAIQELLHMHRHFRHDVEVEPVIIVPLHPAPIML